MEKFDLAPAEWNIMECLWECAPQTGRELTEQLEASMGWSRSTTLTLLRRMVGKGVVTCDTEGTKNTFLYDTPFGSATMGLDTHRIHSTLGPKGGDMEIDYVVDFDHAVVGRNKFRINVRERGGAADGKSC